MLATGTAALRAHLRAYSARPEAGRHLIRSAPGIPSGTTFHRLRDAYASLLGDAVSAGSVLPRT